VVASPFVKVLPQHIRAVALREAQDAKHKDVAHVPEQERVGLIARVAHELGVPRAQVFHELAVEWMESAGAQGAKGTGAELGPSDAGERRPGGLGQGAVHVRFANVAMAKRGPAAPKTLQETWAALEGVGKTSVKDERPYAFEQTVAKRGQQVDELLADKGPGEYGILDLKNIPDDHPALDLPVFRGMGAADPAVHALHLTGKLIPSGTGSDYEGFKKYSHREALDGYEWSLDPYIAMKGAGAYGTLVQATLRDLLQQDGVEVTRKTTDTEGGFFVAGTVDPAAMRTIAHEHRRGKGTYELSEQRDKPGDKASAFAQHLTKKVPGLGGWDGFMELGNGKVVKTLQRQALRSGLERLMHWTDRLKQEAPDDPLLDKVPQLVKQSREKHPDNYAHTMKVVDKLLEAVQMRAVDVGLV
jgi:hypothetical protein